MKISIKKDVLVEVVSDVSKAISSKVTIPALSTIKIVTEDNQVVLTGSNSDISIEATIPAKAGEETLVNIEKTGGILLNANFFSEIIKKLSGDFIDIEVGDNFNASIQANGSNFSLNGLDAEEYPKLATVKGGKKLKIKSKVLKNLIKKSNYAVSTSETRPILTGANWQIKDGVLVSYVTDSHRLVKMSVEVGGDTAEETIVTIPGSSLKELEKILLDNEDDITVILTDNQVLFQFDNLLFYSRLLEGNFPDVKKLIPQESEVKITVNRAKFKGAVDRANLLAKDKNNVIKFEKKSDNLLLITSNNPEIGKIEEEVTCELIEGDELIISASAKYMLDALGALDGDEAYFRFHGTMRPFLVNKKGEDEKETHLILPVRTA